MWICQRAERRPREQKAGQEVKEPRRKEYAKMCRKRKTSWCAMLLAAWSLLRSSRHCLCMGPGSNWPRTRRFGSISGSASNAATEIGRFGGNATHACACVLWMQHWLPNGGGVREFQRAQLVTRLAMGGGTGSTGEEERHRQGECQGCQAPRGEGQSRWWETEKEVVRTIRGGGLKDVWRRGRS